MPRGDARRRFLPFAIVLPILLLGIFDHDLWTPDEPRAAEISREFLEPGHSWTVPTLDGSPFLEKPPLVYWASAASMRIFGVNAPAARLPCLLLGIGTLLFTGLLGRSLYGEEAGRGALLILATTTGFFLVSHHLESDSGLACFTAGAAYSLYRALTGPSRWFLTFHLCLLGGFFSKGLIAIAFMGLLLVSWIAWTRSWNVLLRPTLWLGLPILILPIALWLLAISRDPRGDLLRVFLVDNHVGRFTGSGDVSLGHRHPFYYYAVQFPAQSAPWIAGLVVVLPRLRSRLQDPRTIFLLAWLIPGLLFLSAASTKRGIYAVPLLPPLAILTAEGLIALGKGSWIPAISGGLAALVALAVVVVIPRVEPRKTLRPFVESLAARCGPATRICGLDPDETTRAVIPFYMGRRVEAVGLGGLESLSRQTAPVALVVGPRITPTEQELIQRYFPVLWWESPTGHSRHLWIYSKK